MFFSPDDEWLISVPQLRSFPTSFATENERLNSLIYATELCMNPSEAADLQMTQAGWHHCSSPARSKAERRSAGEKSQRSFFFFLFFVCWGKKFNTRRPLPLTKRIIHEYTSWRRVSTALSVWFVFTHSDRKIPLRLQRWMAINSSNTTDLCSYEGAIFYGK